MLFRSALIRREVSEMLLHGIRDLRVIEGMVSVTRVDVARDLQHCRIHVSVFGDESERQDILAGLKAATPYVKGELGRRLKLRRTPDVVFNLDRGLEEGSNVLGLLERLETERLSRAEHDPNREAEPEANAEALVREPGGVDACASDAAAGTASAPGPTAER